MTAKNDNRRRPRRTRPAPRCEAGAGQRGSSPLLSLAVTTTSLGYEDASGGTTSCAGRLSPRIAQFDLVRNAEIAVVFAAYMSSHARACTAPEVGCTPAAARCRNSGRTGR